MKLGYVQFAPLLGEVQATVERLDRLIDRAASADILVLPELCNSGYNFDSPQTAWQTSEEIAKSSFVEFLVSKCQKHDQFIVSGFNERDGNILYNSAILVGAKGFVGKYRKLHLFMNEKDFFQPGDIGLPVFDLGVCKLGMLVCFDWRFPEVWRILALKGADMICHPSNPVLPGLIQKSVPIHSLVNRIYVVTSNRIGEERGLRFTGQSTIANPDGEIILQASSSEEEVGLVDVDISSARDKRVTSRNDVFADRRPSEYSLLMQNGI